MTDVVQGIMKEQRGAPLKLNLRGARAAFLRTDGGS